MLKFNRLVYFFVFFIIVGCGWAPKGKGPVFSLNPAQDNMSTVYHYRIPKLCGNGAAYVLYSNGEIVTLIGNGGYYDQHIKPGTYEYKTIFKNYSAAVVMGALMKAQPAHTYTIKTEPNETYFLRWNACLTTKDKKHVEAVPEEIALRELKGLKKFKSKE